MVHKVACESSGPGSQASNDVNVTGISGQAFAKTTRTRPGATAYGADFSPQGRRARSVEAGSRALGYGSGAGGVPTHSPEKSFTNLSNLRAHRSPTHLDTYLRQRWRGDGKEQNQPPSGSHLPQKQLPVHTPSTTVPHTVHTPRGIFRARAGHDVLHKLDGRSGCKTPAPWQRETGRNQLHLQRLQRVPTPPWRMHSYGREGQGDTNCACSCVNEPSAASFATN